MNELAPPPPPASWEAEHAPRHMTADGFLLWDGDGSGRKFHLIDGKVWAMFAASATVCLECAVERVYARTGLVRHGTVR